jgi:putative ABC transport system ATP-binding protein
MTDVRPAVTVRGVKKSFPLADGRTLEVLDVPHLELPAERITVLRGRSGSGKTTLLNVIAGVSAPTAGTVVVQDTDLFSLPEAARDRFRARRLGYVFQAFNLLPAFSAEDNVVLGMTFADCVPRRAQRARAREILDRLGLGARLGHRPAQLSRGEQQRVAIARALANDPPLVLADEPCASLDGTTSAEVLAAFVTVCRDTRKTVLMVSHDDVALGAADVVLDIASLNRAAPPGAPAPVAA